MEQAEDHLSGLPDGAFLVRDSSDADHVASVSFRSCGATHHTRVEHFQGALLTANLLLQHGSWAMTLIASHLNAILPMVDIINEILLKYKFEKVSFSIEMIILVQLSDQLFCTNIALHLKWFVNYYIIYFFMFLLKLKRHTQITNL